LSSSLAENTATIVLNPQEAKNHKELVAKILSAGINIIEDTLEVGDILVLGAKERILIERKDLNDFLLSGYGRIWEQVSEMSKNDDRFTLYVLVEGTEIWDNQLRRPVYWATWCKRYPDKAKMFYQEQYGVQRWRIPIIWTADVNGTAEFLIGLAKKLGKPADASERPMRGGFKKDWSLEQKRKYLFEAFGTETGHTLFKQFQSPANLINTLSSLPMEKKIEAISELKLKSERRIGEKKAKEILEVFGLIK